MNKYIPIIIDWLGLPRPKSGGTGPHHKGWPHPKRSGTHGVDWEDGW